MKLTELLERSGAKREYVRSLVGQGLLPRPEGGGKGAGNAADYSEGYLLRLRVILRLRKIGVVGAEKVRAWIGGGNGTEVPDWCLPAVAYVLNVSGVDTEEARHAAEAFFCNTIGPIDAYKERISGLLEGGASEETRGFLYLVSGTELACNTDLYRSSDALSIYLSYEDLAPPSGSPVSLLDGLASMANEIRSPIRPPYRRLEPEEAGAMGYVFNPEVMLTGFRAASAEVLTSAAKWTWRLARGVDLTEKPHADMLLLLWVCLASLLQNPAIREALTLMKAGVTLAGKLRSGQTRGIGAEAKSLATAVLGSEKAANQP